MNLNILWFVLITVLYLGYFLLEGFDFGVGILLPFLSKDSDAHRVDIKRRLMINTIGPHWDGNEVWLITAGGATFAAFPHWYATLFSGFYLALFLLLLALIMRGVAFEFRSKDENPRWRATWDWAIFIGSLIPAILLGITFANLLLGVPIDANMNYVGTFFDLLNPYALLGGITTLITFTIYGALFLNLKTTGEVKDEAEKAFKRLWPWGVIIQVIFWVVSFTTTDMMARTGALGVIIPLVGIVTLLISSSYLSRKEEGWAFVLVAATVALTLVNIFVGLYPRVMVSSLNDTWSLTIQNAASSPYTLWVMTIVALIFTPIVLIYQGWSYWVFRKRIGQSPEKLVY
ncbi:MAG: cytochrome d ubiquinol oxidase subunit II [Anaerolineales bacterium]|nr:cytochrome d ubiquinol oxidase subunit II [Anaerolineales bacterium]